MPENVLRAYIGMMPRIQARESLRRVSEFSIGSGSAKKEDRARIIRTWQREANEGIEREKTDPRDQLNKLREWGLPVRREAKS